MNDKLLVSICIPVHNGETYLTEALESAVNQSYENIEIVISDDGSTDKSLDVIANYKLKYPELLKVFKKSPAGIGSNWNYCIKHSRGEYIKFLFQDDKLDTNCIEVMLTAAIESNCRIIASKRKLLIEDSADDHFQTQWLANCTDLQTELSSNNNQPLRLTKALFKQDYFLNSPRNKVGEPSCSLIRKSVFSEIGLYNENLLQILDYEFWYRCLLISDIYILPEKLVSFRLHSKQTSSINYYQEIPDETEWNSFLRKTLFKHMSFKNQFIILRRTSPFISRLYNILKSIQRLSR